MAPRRPGRPRKVAALARNKVAALARNKVAVPARNKVAVPARNKVAVPARNVVRQDGLLETAIRTAVRDELQGQLASLQADLETLSLGMSALSELAPALRLLAAVQREFLGATAQPPARAAVRAGPALRAAAVAPEAAAPASEEADRACAVIGCRRPFRSRGYCSAHYQRRRLMESTGRLPASWVEDAAPHSVPDVLLPRGRRRRNEVVAEPVEPKPSGGPRVWVRKKGQEKQPLAPLGAASTSPAVAEA
jgi:hypothetical protein